MTLKSEILASFYQDSVVLMRISGQIRGLPGVREAAAFMGTASNHALLEQAGLATDESRGAGADDLIFTIDAENEEEAEAAIAAARKLLIERRQSSDEAAETRPRTLNSALRILPDANLVSISIPGAFVKTEAMRALNRDLHLFIFSDNVPLEDEIQLKQEARRRGLLCMGPDCGTAYLNGRGLGFVNVVPRGRVGCVAASGTGLQAVVSHLARLGEGVSHGIGVGGRDLSAEVGGVMTLSGLNALAADSSTEAVILVSKPPHPDVLPRLEEAIATTGKPTIVCSLGASNPSPGEAVWVDTLDAAAEAAVAVLRGETWSPRKFSDSAVVCSRLTSLRAEEGLAGSCVLGLYTGGTLAHEARLLLEPLLGDVCYNQESGAGDSSHRILDLGDDMYTAGRPHPMIDPEARAEFIQEAGSRGEVSVLLLDLVLGRASHPNPVEAVATSLERARSKAESDGRRFAAVASVIGTPMDPQGFAEQVARLEEAGVEVFPSNAEATRFAALLVSPELSGQLLGDAA